MSASFTFQFQLHPTLVSSIPKKFLEMFLFHILTLLLWIKNDFKSLSEHFPPVFPELKLNPVLLDFWQHCAEKEALYVNAESFLLQLDVKFGAKLRTTHPDIADDGQSNRTRCSWLWLLYAP